MDSIEETVPMAIVEIMNVYGLSITVIPNMDFSFRGTTLMSFCLFSTEVIKKMFFRHLHLGRGRIFNNRPEYSRMALFLTDEVDRTV